MLFYNRLTENTEYQLPDQLILGQWQVITNLEQVFLNSFALNQNSREYLFNDSANHCSLRSEDGKICFDKQFSTWQLPSSILSESLRFFENELQKLILNSATWLDLVKLSPLIPNIQEKINIQPLEATVKQNLSHLEEICRHPRSYLKLETERLIVSRAQRISPHAAEFLASHTEDWERRTFRSVIPKRVLCMVKDELLDIYENKVTVRLIDNLLEYTTRRIQQVETLKRQLDEAQYLSGENSDIYWRNQKRIYKLWGNHFDAAIATKKAEVTLKELHKLNYKLRTLIDTNLYKSISSNFVLPKTLQRTNILVNDQHYRYVDLLWKKWSNYHNDLDKNTRQVFEENQKALHGFESFCLLLIGLALTGNSDQTDKGLGFHSNTNKLPTRNGQAVQFQGRLGEISLTWENDGSFLLQADNIKPLRLVPIIASLASSNKSETITSVLAHLSANLINSSEKQTIILYPNIEEAQKKLPLHIQRKMNTLGNEHLHQEVDMPIVPVSPLDIVSLERVTRAVQWWLNGQRYQLYPFTLSGNIPDSLLIKINWLKKDIQNNLLYVLRQPYPEERKSFKISIENLVNQANARRSKVRDEISELQKIANLPEQTDSIIQPLKVCPVCNADGSFQPLDNQSFKCECSECRSIWGTRTCGHCSIKYPYIQLISVESKNRQPGWVERTLGRDVLAVPCCQYNGDESFICPNCGKCGQTQSSQQTNPTCVRCQSKTQ